MALWYITTPAEAMIEAPFLEEDGCMATVKDVLEEPKVFSEGALV